MHAGAVRPPNSSAYPGGRRISAAHRLFPPEGISRYLKWRRNFPILNKLCHLCPLITKGAIMVCSSCKYQKTIIQKIGPLEDCVQSAKPPHSISTNLLVTRFQGTLAVNLNSPMAGLIYVSFILTRNCESHICLIRENGVTAVPQNAESCVHINGTVATATCRMKCTDIW